MLILEVKNLTITFNGKKAVDDVSLELYQNEIVGLVGESGCGKSLTAFSILGIFPPGGNLTGKIIYRNIDLLSLDDKSKREIRGNKIALIPQDPLSAFNPVFTIGDQIGEVLEVHKGATYKQAQDVTEKILERVNVPNPRLRLKDYPHQFSGGMRQRALIAMALISDPDILIADEPTTALDVTIQLQILELLKELRNKGKSILLISHDLGIISDVCDRIFVMYLGKIVESANVKELFSNPKHPYTIGLLNSLPTEDTKKQLNPIKGQPPTIESIPNGCAFHTRCPYVFEKCRIEIPELYDIKDSPEHKSKCFLYNAPYF